MEIAIATRVGFNGYTASPEMLFRFALVILVCELCLYFTDLYDFRLTLGEIAARLLQAFGLASLTLTGIYFIIPTFEPGRGIALMTLPLSFMLTLSWRAMVAEPPKMTSARF